MALAIEKSGNKYGKGEALHIACVKTGSIAVNHSKQIQLNHILTTVKGVKNDISEMCWLNRSVFLDENKIKKIKKKPARNHFKLKVDFQEALKKWEDEVKTTIFLNVFENCGYHFFSNTNPYLTVWETQKLFSQISDNYKTTAMQLMSGIRFYVQTGIEVSYYKKNTKKNKKGDLKTYKIKRQTTKLSGILKYLVKCNADIGKYNK